jgi:predicted CXXCH cytochrome family protein
MTTLTKILGAAGLAALAVAFTPRSAQAQTQKHQCSYCHNLHGGSFQALGVRDLQVDLCQWCHDPDGGQGTTIDGKTIPKQGRNAEALSGFADHVGVRSSDSWQPSCWDCHNHEGEADSTTRSRTPTPIPHSSGCAKPATQKRHGTRVRPTSTWRQSCRLAPNVGTMPQPTVPGAIPTIRASRGLVVVVPGVMPVRNLV